MASEMYERSSENREDALSTEQTNCKLSLFDPAEWFGREISNVLQVACTFLLLFNSWFVFTVRLLTQGHRRMLWYLLYLLQRYPRTAQIGVCCRMDWIPSHFPGPYF